MWTCERPAVALAALLAATACGPAVPRARTSAAQPASAREIDSKRRVDGVKSCPVGLRWILPGIGHACHGRGDEAATLMGVTAADTAVLVAGLVEEHESAAILGSVGLQNAWAAGVLGPTFEMQRAERLRFVPQDTLGELVVAPFNPRLLARPEVWATIVGLSGAGLALSWLLPASGPRPAEPRPERDPRLFGADVPGAAGYAAAACAFVGTFSQVAIGEEMVFRGWAQSGLARTCGEACGWALGSAIFGAAHATNVFGFDDGETRVRYLAIGLPFITLAGQAHGLVYWHGGYALAPPVALHFWYDFLVSAASFALDPGDSILAARIGGPI